MNNLQQQNGLTLVELLIASTLGLLLMLGVTQLFVSSSNSFRMAESIGRIQESGRLAQDIIGRTIRNADYWGCINSSDLDSIINESNTAEFDEKLHGFSGSGSGFEAIQFAIGDASNDAVPGTVAIQLKGARSPGISTNNPSPVSPLASDVIPVSTIPAGLFGKNGLVLLTDCINGVVFQLSGVDVANSKIELEATGGAKPGNISGTCSNGSTLTNCFPDSYQDGDIFVPFSETYYIHEDNDGRRALVYDGFGGTGKVDQRELVSDVIDMQVQVGTGPQDNSVVDSWQTLAAGNLATLNSSYVKAIRISLLVSSPEDGVAGSQQSACYPAWADCSGGNNWQSASTGDRHYYRVYTSTYSIRNRLLDTN